MSSTGARVENERAETAVGGIEAFYLTAAGRLPPVGELVPIMIRLCRGLLCIPLGEVKSTYITTIKDTGSGETGKSRGSSARERTDVRAKGAEEGPSRK